MTKRRMRIVISLVLALATTATRSQPAASVQQRSDKSVCSNVVALTGDVNINCSSLTPEQLTILKQIPILLNQLLSKQVDLVALKREMSEILKLVQANSASAIIEEQRCEAGSLCNQGTEVNAPQTVQNNFGPQPRRLTEEQKRALIAALQGKDVKVHFGYLADSPDAHQYAVELCSVVKVAIPSTSCAEIWQMSDESGTPLVGLQIQYKGEKIPQGSTLRVSFDTPVGVVLKALLASGLSQGFSHADPTMKDDEVTVVVGASPQH